MDRGKTAIGSGPERPLAAVRTVIDREQAEVESVLRSYRAELESRLQAAENQTWRRERQVLELEGYLSRAAAVVGVDVQEPPDWNLVVSAVTAATERIRELELVVGRMRASLERAEIAASRSSAHAAALARIAARLGLKSVHPGEILRALEALPPRDVQRR